ncbi:hypothetical protein NKDENANG_00927 [Candidatus Entotheonellaceae bacterium PAL068K]
MLEQHCHDVGRDPATSERYRQVIVGLCQDAAELPDKMAQAQERFALFGDMQQLAIRGTPVKMPHIGAENRLQPVIPLLVEGACRADIIRLTAGEEMAGKLLLQLLCRGNVGRGEVI